MKHEIHRMRPVMSGNRCCGFHKSGMSSYIHPDQNCQFRWGDADRRTGSSSEIDVGASCQPQPQQRKTKHRAHKIKIVSNAPRLSPSHAGENFEVFSDVREHDHDKAG